MSVRSMGRRAAPSRTACLIFATLTCPLATGAAGEPVPELEQLAVQGAASSAAHRLVRLEVFGGRRVSGLAYDRGPTSGVLLDEKGYIITSLFGVGENPEGIMAVLPDGRRAAARMVATDQSRELVLLKVDIAVAGPPLEIAPKDEIRVGQWAIALGRTLSSQHPNLSLGIVSALDRVWGKAIQTDAKISPNNYGGLLLDIRGRAMGILVPMARESPSEIAGVEWYDSGIGFAIPLEDVIAVLPRLKSGENLQPGVLGVYLEQRELYEPVVISGTRPGSPAHRAGWKRGDQVASINGKAVPHYAAMKRALGPLYGGDTVRVALSRHGQTLESDLQLVAELPPVHRVYLGILPERPLADAEQAEGVRVRHVFPGSPAESAGLAPGDRITHVDGQEIGGRREMDEILAGYSVGQRPQLTVVRYGATMQVELSATAFPEAVPDFVPEPQTAADVPADRPPVGVIDLENPVVQKEGVWVYVPENLDPRKTYGLLMYLQAPGELDRDGLLARWKAWCDLREWILFVPLCGDKDRWEPGDLDWIRRRLAGFSLRYPLDPARMVVHGEAGGGSLAYVWGLGSARRAAGVSVADAAIPYGVVVPGAEPAWHVQFFVTAQEGSRDEQRIANDVALMRERKHPVVFRTSQRGARDSGREDYLKELQRWIDAVDRL